MEAQVQINELDYLASNENTLLQIELSEFDDLQEHPNKKHLMKIY